MARRGRVCVTICAVGLFGKDKKQDRGSDWIQPAQLLAELGAPRAAGSGGQPVPARLRLMTGAANSDWLNGALVLTPGSIVWQPDAGVTAQPVELATAMVLPGTTIQGRRSGLAMVTEVETTAGRFQLDMDPQLFEMTQELVAEEAAKRAGPPAGPGPF